MLQEKAINIRQSSPSVRLLLLSVAECW